MGKRFGIDVSHWQGDFNFAKAKNNEGVEFAIIKAGGVMPDSTKTADLRAITENVWSVDFQREHTSMGMQKAWLMQRKRQSILFLSLVARNMNTLSFMMLRVK